MDSFVEQLIVKKTEGKDIFKRFALLCGGIFLFLFSLVVSYLTYMFFFALLGGGALYLSWYMVQSTFVEYEYIITNNEMDIDKISAKRKRKRLITIKINKTEEWGEYSEGKGADAAATVQAHDCSYENLWYIVTQHEKYGKVNLLFSPNNSILEAVNKGVPYSLRKKLV